MKKNIILLSFFLCILQGIYAQNSIKDVIRRFDEKLGSSSIPSAETVIGHIYFAETETNGTVATWMKDEIAKAAVKTRRIKIVLDSLKTTQIEAKTRSLPPQIKKSTYKKKYTISGKYIENKAKGVVSLTLRLEVSDGNKTEIVASETAIIPVSELSDYGLTLYPQNIERVKTIEKDFDTAFLSLEQNNSTETALEKKDVNMRREEITQAIRIKATMLDRENNVVDTLHPGDIVKFLVDTNIDAYVRILGIDAEGNSFWLPIKNNFIPANTVRTFSDDNTVDYQVVDGVFGAEHLFIYASTQEEGLPTEFGNSRYHSSLIADAARGMVAVKKNEKLITGVFKIAYTVEP